MFCPGKTLWSYCGIYFLTALVCVDVMVMSSASDMTRTAIFLGMVVILLLNVMEVVSVNGGALLDKLCVGFQRMCTLWLRSQCACFFYMFVYVEIYLFIQEFEHWITGGCSPVVVVVDPHLHGCLKVSFHTLKRRRSSSGFSLGFKCPDCFIWNCSYILYPSKMKGPFRDNCLRYFYL